MKYRVRFKVSYSDAFFDFDDAIIAIDAQAVDPFAFFDTTHEAFLSAPLSVRESIFVFEHDVKHYSTSFQGVLKRSESEGQIFHTRHSLPYSSYHRSVSPIG